MSEMFDECARGVYPIFREFILLQIISYKFIINAHQQGFVLYPDGCI